MSQFVYLAFLFLWTWWVAVEHNLLLDFRAWMLLAVVSVAGYVFQEVTSATDGQLEEAKE